jgi:hypothetical protein
MAKNLKELISKVKEITASGLPFMEGKDKTDLADGEIYNVVEYGYLQGQDDNGNEKEYVVISDGKTFAYGGAVVTEAFRQLDENLKGDEIEELLNEGIPMMIRKKKSQKGRKYTTCEFFPNL